jgi:mRNA-degrading endonuclease RelE of RelBE toxin-antitoxin system
MSYTVRVAPSALQELSARVPEGVGTACIRFVYGALAADPRAVGTALRGPFEGLWRSARGEYRIHYRIDDEHGTVDILDMTHTNQLAVRALLPES